MWEDINIVGADDSKTHRPDPAKELYDVHLTLSSDPPAGWVKCFEAQRQMPRHSMWRRAWVQGANVVIRCGLDEVERYHLADLKNDVANANKLYREILEKQEQYRILEQQKKEAEQEHVRKALGKLDFD